MKRSIFSKLLVSFMAVILISTFSLGVLMSFFMRNHIIEKQRSDLFNKGRTTLALLEPSLSAGKLPVEKTMTTLGELVGATLWISDSDGNILAGKPPQRWLTRRFPEKDSDVNELFSGTPQSWVRNSRKQADPSIIAALPIASTPTPTALFLYTPITGVYKTAEALENLLLYALVLGIIIAAIVSYFISRGFTRPITDISNAAARFSGGDYNARTNALGDDEIGKLGFTFNSMAESLAHAEQNRREFLANVSHELKTPIASIQALSEAILDGVAAKPEQQERYLSTIVDETKRLDRLIGDLLDLSQLEAGKLLITPRTFNLNEFIKVDLLKYTSLLDAKQLSFFFAESPDNLIVWADSDRLSQILANLISNAVRYSPEGGKISITTTHDNSFAIIAVNDLGQGIPADDLPYIWDRFYRVDKSRSRQDGGTGLGLAITKKLTEAMGGTIEAESPAGQGTTFRLSLPLNGLKNH